MKLLFVSGARLVSAAALAGTPQAVTVELK